jgi:hypothetical protein
MLISPELKAKLVLKVYQLACLYLEPQRLAVFRYSAVGTHNIGPIFDVIILTISIHFSYLANKPAY